MVGDPIGPVITCDRYSTYAKAPDRQTCWAHLRRDFQSMIDRTSGGQADDPELASDLEALAWLHALQGNDVQAGRMLEKALKLYQLGLASEHICVARCCTKLGQVCLRQGHQEDAEKNCKNAVTLLEKSAGDPLETAAALDAFAAALRKAGKDDEAEKVEAKAKSLREVKKSKD